MYPLVVLRKMNLVIGMFCDDYCCSENLAGSGIEREKTETRWE